MDGTQGGQDEEQSNNSNLEILKNFWTRHVQESILSTWMNTDKRNFSTAECKVINDKFVETFNIIQMLDVTDAAQFAHFMQNINTIWTLIHKPSQLFRNTP